MPQIIKSLIIIAAMATLSVNATGAYFTSSITTRGPIFTTGTLQLSKADPTVDQKVVFDKISPGQSMIMKIDLKNTGNLDIYHLHLSAVDKTGSNELLDHINVLIQGQVDNNQYGTYSSIATTTVNNGLNNADILENYILPPNAPNYPVPQTILPAGSTYHVYLMFFMPTETNNDWQNQNAAFDLFFDAQTTASPPLLGHY